MIRDITIGQYYPTNSIIHKLDPRTKLFATMIYVISLFLINSFVGYFWAFIFLYIIIKMSKVPFKFMIKGLKSIMFLLLISVAFNIFLTDGRELIKFGILRITDRGLLISAYMAVRLVLLIIGSSIMTLTTTPKQLTDGLEKGLSVLNIIKVPVHEIAMMMSIALRYIPILIEETDKIMKAQIARGADFETGNAIKRAKSMVPLLIPLFVSAFRRAFDLSMAMEARCYNGGAGRTKYKPLKYERKDYVAYISLFIYLITVVLIFLNKNYILSLIGVNI